MGTTDSETQETLNRSGDCRESRQAEIADVIDAAEIAEAAAPLEGILIEEPSWRMAWRDPSDMSVGEAEMSDDHVREKFRRQSNADFGEVGAIRRATPLVEAFGGRLPLPRELADIREYFGLETAQTVFTLAVERSLTYGGLIRRVRNFDVRDYSAVRDLASSFEVTIVRSSLPIRGIEWGAFASTWQTWARSLGFTTDIIDTLEDNDVRENARVISTYLFSNPHPRRILVTYGQGAAEIRSLLTSRLGVRGRDVAPGLKGDVTLDRQPNLAFGEAAELGSIHTWLNIAGAVGGASIARIPNDSVFQSMLVGLSHYFGRFSLASRARRWRQLDSRLPASRALPKFPPQLQVINVVGLPLVSQIPMNLMVSYEQLSREIGPNDGAIGVYESIAHPGLIVPVAGMTHNVENVKIEPIFKRLLAIIAMDADVSLLKGNPDFRPEINPEIRPEL